MLNDFPKVVFFTRLISICCLNRQSNKEAKKEEATLQEKRELTNTLNDFALQLERQDALIRQLNRQLAELGMYAQCFE